MTPSELDGADHRIFYGTKSLEHAIIASKHVAFPSVYMSKFHSMRGNAGIQGELELEPRLSVTGHIVNRAEPNFLSVSFK